LLQSAVPGAQKIPMPPEDVLETELELDEVPAPPALLAPPAPLIPPAPPPPLAVADVDVAVLAADDPPPDDAVVSSPHAVHSTASASNPQ
jgi:hypothetical protein